MKNIQFIFLSIVAIGLVSCDQTPVTPTTHLNKNAQLKNSLDSVSYALGVNVARTLNGQGFDSINYEAFNIAIAASLNSDTLLMDQTHSLRYINTYLQGLSKSFLEKNLTIANKFIDSISHLENVKKIDDGIYMRIIKEGTGNPPTMNDEVVFNYLGQLPDGREFDNSFNRGEPVIFNVNTVIEGWQIALGKMNEGTISEIWVAPEKGYGTHGGYNGIIPGNSALYFKIELVRINRK